jgi:hypothetical protein
MHIRWGLSKDWSKGNNNCIIFWKGDQGSTRRKKEEIQAARYCQIAALSRKV